MSNELTSLVIVVDTTQAAKATVDLDKLTASADVVEESVTRAGKAASGSAADYVRVSTTTSDAALSAEKWIKKLQEEFDALGRTRAEIERMQALAANLQKSEVDKITALAQSIDSYHRQEQVMKDMVKSQDDAASAAERFIAKLKAQADTVGMTRKEILAFQAAQLGVSNAAAPLIAGLQDAGHAAAGFSLSSSTATRELIVMSRELANGNFTRMGSSFSIFAQSSGLLAAAMNPLGLTIAAVAASAGVLAAAYTFGAMEAEKFKASLILTGGAAGVTAQQLQAMALATSTATGSTIGKSAEAITAFSSSGRFAADQISQFSATAIKMQREMGISLEDSVKQFAELGRSPVDASIKLNESMHYLTLGVFEHIKAMNDMGDRVNAAKAAEEAYADAMNQRMPVLAANLGVLEQTWRGVGEMAKAGWDAMLGIGRTEDPTAKLARQLAAFEKYATFKRSGGGGLTPEENAQLVALEKQAEVQKTIDYLALMTAENRRKDNEQAIAGIAFDTIADRYLDKALLTNREITRVTLEGLAAGKSRLEIDKVIANIRAANAAKPESVSAYQTFIADMQKYEDAANLEIETGKKLTAAQKLESDSLVNLWSKYTQGKMTLDEAVDAENRMNDAVQAMTKSEADLARQKERADAIAEYSKTVDGIDKTVASVLKQIEAEKLQIASWGLTKGAIEALNLVKIQQQAVDAKKRADMLQGLGDDDLVRKGLLEEAATYAELVRLKKVYADLQAKKEQDGAFAYWSTIQDQAIATQTVVSKAFKGMEDALVTFATTGKLDFNGLANSIIADLIRIQIQQSITKPLSQAMSNAGGMSGIASGVASLFGFATGGNPTPGVPYLVGENGPEIRVDTGPGVITPNHLSGSGGAAS